MIQLKTIFKKMIELKTIKKNDPIKNTYAEYSVGNKTAQLI